MRSLVALVLAVGFFFNGTALALGDGPSKNYLPLVSRNAPLDYLGYAPPSPRPTNTPIGGGPGVPPPPATPTFSPTATRTPTPSPTSTPTPTPTSTPSPTPTACAQRADLLLNGGFEYEGAWSIVLGNPYRSTLWKWAGNYSMHFGWTVSSTDSIVQTVVVPPWADTAAVYFYALMFSNDSTVTKHDWLRVMVTTPDLSVILAAGDVPNNSIRGSWERWRLAVPGITSYRGQSLLLAIGGVNDVSLPTRWYVDNVEMVFGCGIYAASLDARDVLPAES
ncbi:MAG: hypothetical protein RMM58_04040 [Chloroflexota bacterium]|nr:hypothetical protein [Dehalococcoidia bacterium]MDW8253032.1 hypothetical protein [Chloroflexota bacterium]